MLLLNLNNCEDYEAREHLCHTRQKVEFKIEGIYNENGGPHAHNLSLR